MDGKRKIKGDTVWPDRTESDDVGYPGLFLSFSLSSSYSFYKNQQNKNKYELVQMIDIC